MEVPAGASWRGNDVDAGSVARQLAGLWSEVTSNRAHPGSLRTSILNLVVYTSSESEAERVSGELRSCSRRHPSRTIILVGDRHQAGSAVDASASVYCSDAHGHLPLCYEEIVITGHGRVADHLGSVVMPLLLPELPTYLWWPGQPPFGHRTFHRLLSIADQLVVDSTQFSMPGDGLANIARVCQGRQGVNDFNWGRLTPWREIVAQFFDGPSWLPYAEAIRSVRLEFGSGTSNHRRSTAGTLLLLGWMAAQLHWEPETTLDGVVTQDTTLSVLKGDRLVDIDLTYRDRGDVLAGRLTGIELVSQPKNLGPARLAVQRVDELDHARVTMSVHDGAEIDRVVPLQIKPDLDLLTDELERAGHDKLYEAVVDMASRIAGRETWIPT